MIDRVRSRRGVACGRSVSQGRPGRWALAAGGLGERAAEHLRDDGRARVLMCLGGGSDRFLFGGCVFDRGERVLAELAEDVIGAPAELAGDREAGAIVIDSVGDLEVVAAVGRAGASGRLRRFEQGPAQDRGSLVGEVPGGALLVGLVDGDVEAGVADGVVGRGEAAGIAELGQDRVAVTGPTPYRRSISARQPG